MQLQGARWLVRRFQSTYYDVVWLGYQPVIRFVSWTAGAQRLAALAQTLNPEPQTLCLVWR